MCLHVLLVLLFDELSCFIFFFAFKRYVFFSTLFGCFFPFSLYSKAQLSTVADLRFYSFATSFCVFFFLWILLANREYLLMYVLHRARGVSGVNAMLAVCFCSLCVCWYLNLMVSTSPLIFCFVALKLSCEYINVSNQSKWIHKLQLCWCVLVCS